MDTFQFYWQQYDFNRTRTLALLDEIDGMADSAYLLAWRPGPGRAPIGWQLAHIGVSEEIFATERLAPEKNRRFESLWPLYRGGSTPSDEAPGSQQIREVLAAGREAFQETVAELGRERLDEIVFVHPQQNRELTLRNILQILCWHEPHHQGQAHLTLNKFKNEQ